MAGFLSESLITTKKPISDLPSCGVCGLYKDCQNPRIPVQGKGKILIVGHAPSQEEDRQGVYLTGEPGKFLKGELGNIDYLVTKALICKTVDALPPLEQINACRPNLLKVIEEHKPNVIIPLGNTAIESVIGNDFGKNTERKNIDRWIGQQIPSRKYNAWICPNYHPAYVLELNDPAMNLIFSNTLKQAIEIKEKPYTVIPDEQSEIQILSEKEAVLKIKEYRKQGGTMAFDYETTGLKPDHKDHEIVSCSICWNNQETIAFMVNEEVRYYLAGILQSGRVRKIASNMKFEDRWTRAKLDVEIKSWWWDTMLASHILRNDPKSSSIKFEAYTRMGIGDYDGHISKYLESDSPNGFNRIKELDRRDLLIYNGMDSLLEYRVAIMQMQEMGYPFYE